MQESEKRLNTKVLTVHEPVHNLSQSKQTAKLPESKLMACRNDLANSRISRLYVQANYEADKTIQKVIKLPGLTLLLASWLSWQDLAKFLLHLIPVLLVIISVALDLIPVKWILGVFSMKLEKISSL